VISLKPEEQASVEQINDIADHNAAFPRLMQCFLAAAIPFFAGINMHRKALESSFKMSQRSSPSVRYKEKEPL
jgi:hypothetical protein